MWIHESLESGKLTLIHLRLPPKRVTNSPAQIQRVYGKQAPPTTGTRARLFKAYVQQSMLDLPPRLLQWRPEGNQLHIVTFNIENLIGHGKQESLARFAMNHNIDILALRDYSHLL